MVQAFCINDNDKPDEIHPDEWVKAGEIYHITHVYHHPIQGVQGVELKEIELTSRSYPYESYKLSRFAVTMNGFIQLLEMMMNCTELNAVDIEKLLRESELQVVEK